MLIQNLITPMDLNFREYGPMDLLEYTNDEQQRHPWELSRYDFFSSVLNRYGLSGPGSQTKSILDVGSGDGWLVRQLVHSAAKKSTPLEFVYCWDIHYTEAIIEKLQTLSADWQPPISYSRNPPQQKFDLILLLDVLEHVQEDHKFLHSIVRDYLNEKGRLLISVPTWDSLYSDHDYFLQHYRRYSPRKMRNLIQSQGLDSIERGSLFGTLLGVRGLQVIGEKLRLRKTRTRFSASIAKSHSLARDCMTNKSDLADWGHGALLTGAIRYGLNFDNRISQIISDLGCDGLGLSWWTLCKKS